MSDYPDEREPPDPSEYVSRSAKSSKSSRRALAKQKRSKEKEKAIRAENLLTDKEIEIKAIDLSSSKTERQSIESSSHAFPSSSSKRSKRSKTSDRPKNQDSNHPTMKRVPSRYARWEFERGKEIRRIAIDSQGLGSPRTEETEDTKSIVSEDISDAAALKYMPKSRGVDHTHVLENLESFEPPAGEHKLPPPPESSFSRIFYKMGPLGKSRRRREIGVDDGGESSPFQRLKSLRNVFWVTRTMVDETQNPELKIEFDMKEMVIFLIFLALVSIIAYGMITPSMAHLNKSLRHALISRRFESEGVDITFMEIHKPIHFFDYLEQVFLNVAYKEFWYSRGFKQIDVKDEDVGMLYDNKILGMPKIQTKRAKRGICKVKNFFAMLYSACYSYYTESTQDKSDFVGFEEIVWTWEPGNDEVKYRGIISTYEPGGYYQNLQDNREDFYVQIQSLKNNLWINRATRVIIVEVNVYNANVNLFCAIRLAFEIPPTGGIFPSYHFNTVKLTRYLTVMDFFVMGCEMVFCLFTLLYLFQAIRELMYVGVPFFFRFWCLLDMAIALMSLVLSIKIIARAFRLAPKIYKMLIQDFYSINIQSMASEQNEFNNILSLTLFMLWIKFFRFVNFNKAMTRIGRTLSNCAGELLCFFIIFLVIFYAYAILGYVWFGKQLFEFSTLGKTSMTLIRIMSGDVNYNRMSNVDPILAGLFFISFVFIILYLLLNIFISILCHSYGAVMDEGFYNPTQITPFKYVKRAWNKMFKTSEKEQLKLSHRHNQGRHHVTYEEIVDLLQQYNFTKQEIDMFLSKYKIREFSLATREDVSRIVRDIENRSFIPYGPQEERELIESFELGEGHEGEKGPEAVEPPIDFIDYETLQARLDQIEIQFELMAERLNVICKRTLS